MPGETVVGFTPEDALKQEILQASMRAMNHMLFGLRDEVSSRTFLECLDGLEKVYGNT